MDLMHAVTKRAPAAAIVNRTVQFILSTDDLDRVGDSIDQSGWDLKNYKKNPVVLWSHDNRQPPIGRMAKIGVVDGDLVGSVEFATGEQNPFADTIFKLVEGGFINAGSVGFKILRYEIREDKNSWGIDIKEQELFEYSICGVPCNPAALRKAADLGVSMEDAPRVLIEAAQHDESARKLLIDTALEKMACKSIGHFKRAYSVRSKEFQLGQLAR